MEVDLQPRALKALAMIKNPLECARSQKVDSKMLLERAAGIRSKTKQSFFALIRLTHRYLLNYASALNECSAVQRETLRRSDVGFQQRPLLRK